jgi:hypothetical protein
MPIRAKERQEMQVHEVLNAAILNLLDEIIFKNSCRLLVELPPEIKEVLSVRRAGPEAA